MTKNFFINLKKDESFKELVCTIKIFSISLLFYLFLFALICLTNRKIDEVLLITFIVILLASILSLGIVTLGTIFQHYLKNRPLNLNDDLSGTDFSNQIKAWSFEHPPWT